MSCRLKRRAEPMRGYGRVVLLSELQQAVGNKATILKGFELGNVSEISRGRGFLKFNHAVERRIAAKPAQ